MRTLILHPTTTAQWHALLTEAQQSSAIYLKEDLESYLVFLLMRFTGEPEIASSILGLDFLHGYQRLENPQQYYQLKDVGDKCLLFAGLFPGRAIKKRVKLSYFVKLGQTAYSTLSNYLSTQEELFFKLCYEFPKLMDVLQAMRENSHSAVDLLQSLELWHETGSSLSWQRLCEATSALPIIPDPNKSVH
ncbi:MAG: hypothetical protein BGO43_06925 [Gammaproteobacteria bacterium 39-13]|nr:hypothetical protein [Gammaproteobacteria bacterium]OJV90568.1 MAG: hypothetical protein BGO43_06925 [Gammaproteobacteria bacterium 39-13]